MSKRTRKKTLAWVAKTETDLREEGNEEISCLLTHPADCSQVEKGSRAPAEVTQTPRLALDSLVRDAPLPPGAAAEVGKRCWTVVELA